MRDELMKELSIDCVIFGFQEELKVLLVKHASGISKGRWALPGGFVTYSESLDDAAYRILNLLTGVSDIFLDQLGAFGEVDRFPDKRVITVAYYSLVADSQYSLAPGYTASDASWFTLDDIPSLPYDHDLILKTSLNELKSKIKMEPVGFNLLQEKFTLLQLQNLYESILCVKLDKPNFRRKILATGLLKDCNEKQNKVSHRAAKYYRFDESVYNKYKQEKFALNW